MLTVFTFPATTPTSETDFMTVVKINDLCKAFSGWFAVISIPNDHFSSNLSLKHATTTTATTNKSKF